MNVKKMAIVAACGSVLVPTLVLGSSSPATAGDVVKCRYSTPGSVGLPTSWAADPARAAKLALGNKSRNRLWQQEQSGGFLTTSTKFASKKLLNKAVATLNAQVKANPGLKIKYKTVMGIRIAIVSGRDSKGDVVFATYATKGLKMSEAQVHATSALSTSVMTKVAAQNAIVVQACALPRSTEVGLATG